VAGFQISFLSRAVWPDFPFRELLDRILVVKWRAQGLRHLHGRDQWADADGVDDAFQIVGEHMQGHFCADVF
jgi:hypothetical protein